MSSSTGSRDAQRSSTEGGRRRRAGGFTLLEVLVAMTILAVALVSLMQAFSSGLRGLSVAEANSALVMQARSTMARVGSLIPLEDGDQEGVLDDGTQWSVVVRPYEGEDEDTMATLPWTPYEVELTVIGTDGATITLNSMRVGAKQ